MIVDGASPLPSASQCAPPSVLRKSPAKLSAYSVVGATSGSPMSVTPGSVSSNRLHETVPAVLTPLYAKLPNVA